MHWINRYLESLSGTSSWLTASSSWVLTWCVDLICCVFSWSQVFTIVLIVITSLVSLVFWVLMRLVDLWSSFSATGKDRYSIYHCLVLLLDCLFHRFQFSLRCKFHTRIFSFSLSGAMFSIISSSVSLSKSKDGCKMKSIKPDQIKEE